MSEDLTGKLVRWENDGQWLIARVEGTGVARGSWRGSVADPGNFIGPAAASPYFAEERLNVGDPLPRLLPHLLTVIDESSAGSQVGDQQ